MSELSNPKNDDDKNYILRRALLLRSLCKRKFGFNEDATAPVSPNIIRAMLHLPSRSQLSLHVDADAFIKLVLDN
ncbi:MAG: hypothetical protein FWC32_06155 [Firmicutes bacterium]|nr:hypothetical protein [Bacillota bacterium]